MKTLRIGKAAEQLNITASTLRKYADDGLISFLTTPNGQRVFTQEAIDTFNGAKAEPITVFYVRSSNGDKNLLQSQTVALQTVYGEPLKTYSDKGSGLNENRKGLTRLLTDAENKEFTRVCITQKDRLTRFGYSYIERHLKNLGIEIVTLGETEEKTLNEELLQDFMSLLASFSGKFYRLRGYTQQRQLLSKAEETINEKAD